MKFKLFCFFYNEAALIPLFLRHYHWVDRIVAFVSPPNSDATLKLLSADPRVHLETVLFPSHKMDDFLKVARLNAALLEPSDADWHFVVDADEFIWPPGEPMYGKAQMEAFLGTLRPFNVVRARMWNVFRHAEDPDLDYTRSPALQRRHGIADLYAAENLPYHKPVATRANERFQYGPGNHHLAHLPHLSEASVKFGGTHWQNADPSFCIQRRIRDRRDRQSEVNLRYGLGSQHHRITERDVLSLCDQHRNDPLCF